MSEEQVESIFQHACEGAAESIGSTRTDWQRVVGAIRFLRRELEASESLRSATISTMRRNEAELTEARRLLDDARVTLVGIAGATARAWELPRNEFIDEFLPWAQSRARDTAAKIAAPVPAQPAAVPEAVAKDAIREFLAADGATKQYEGKWAQPRQWKYNDPEMIRLRAARSALEALLSAADTEVKK